VTRAPRSLWMHAVAVIALLAVAAVVLSSMGRPWWCRAGDVAVWSGDIYSRHNSQHLADPYTFTHVLHGLAFYAIMWALFRRVVGSTGRAWLGLVLEVVWEVGENTDAMIERYRAATISLDYYGDSVANSLSDIAAYGIGYAAASLAPVWLSVAAFFAVDACMVVWIRDSLLLNVLMLVHPVEALRRWQMRGQGG
jgi:hypothetical protein